MMMIIALNSRARKEGRERMEVEGNANYGGMMQPSQEHVAPCVKGVEWELGTTGFRMLESFILAYVHAK